MFDPEVYWYSQNWSDLPSSSKTFNFSLVSRVESPKELSSMGATCSYSSYKHMPQVRPLLHQRRLVAWAPEQLSEDTRLVMYKN